MVNIADQSLKLMDNGKEALGMRVVVGKPYWSTPVFSATMTYLVINPYWNVPPGIARKETIPKTRRNPNYLRENNLKIITGWGADLREINPSAIDWQTVSYRRFPYRFRQDPGPENSLGRVKFMFPNKFHVYLHDTPSRNLFQKIGRAFSHGCIRVEKPIELAEYLLQDTEWNRARIEAETEKRTEKVIRIPQPIPVRIFYWTAWVDEDGVTQFRPDIYKRDEELKRALRETPSAV
jgi:murein L,D-transpeptidase YcbB/YkuD